MSEGPTQDPTLRWVFVPVTQEMEGHVESQYRLTYQSVLAIGLTAGTLLPSLPGGKEVSKKHSVPTDGMLEQADRSV